MVETEREELMRLLHNYIGRSFVTTFLLSLLVLSSVVSLGAIFRITDLIARGVSWRPIFMIFLHGMPAAMAFAIPISALTSSLLVFGRLSGDGEIIAMKACGISMWSIFTLPLLFAFLLSIVNLWISSEVAPRSEYSRRVEVAELGAMSAIDLLEEGRFIKDFPDYTIYIGREDDGLIEDVRIYDLRDNKRREIVAESGKIEVVNNGKDIELLLKGVRIEKYYEERPAFLEYYTVLLPDAFDIKKPRRRLIDMTLMELYGEFSKIDISGDYDVDSDAAETRTELLFMINQRLAVSLSCFAFVLLGSPLGVTAHRRESSVGIAISLGLVLIFYIFVIIAQSLSSRPSAHPEIITWLPVAISVILGAWMVNRKN